MYKAYKIQNTTWNCMSWSRKQVERDFTFHTCFVDNKWIFCNISIPSIFRVDFFHWLGIQTLCLNFLSTCDFLDELRHSRNMDSLSKHETPFTSPSKSLTSCLYCTANRFEPLRFARFIWMPPVNVIGPWQNLKSKVFRITYTHLRFVAK